MPFRLAQCRTCDQLVVWGKTDHGQLIPFNTPKKLWEVIDNEDGTPIVREVPPLLVRHHCAKTKNRGSKK